MKKEEFIEWCKLQHDVECNQKYAKIHPYSFHLELVHNQFKRFSYLIPDGNSKLRPQNSFSFDRVQDGVEMAIYGHDLIEDARVSYNDIKEVVGTDVAEIIFLCTENKGRNRTSRKDEIFYKELNTNKLAVFVKLCDIIANSLYSLATNSTMFLKYREEYKEKISTYLYCEEYKSMFAFLEKLYDL